MAANIEYRVLSMTIDRQDFHSLERLRIDGDYFYSPECRTIYQYLWEHFHKTETFGSVPSWQIINTIFPSFPNTPSADTIDTLCEQLRLAKMRLELLSVADKVQAHADFNPREGMEFLRESAAQMSSKHEMTNDMELHDAYDSFMQDYQMVASGKGVTGLPWPWAPLNEATQGIHKGEFLPLYGRPKNMKCVVAGQKVMTRSGSPVPIEDLPENCEVPSLTEETGKIRWAKARRVYSGEKDCVRVTTESGHVLESSTEHYYRVPEGSFQGSFERIQNLGAGDWIATARTYPKWELKSEFGVKLAWLVGALVGDGNYTRNEVQFTNYDEGIVQGVRVAVDDQFGCNLNRSSKDPSRSGEYRITHPSRRNPLLDFLREHKMHGKRAQEKDVPDFIYRSGEFEVSAFLAGLLDTDGTVWDKAPYSVSWFTSSEELAFGIKNLLIRLGVLSSKYYCSDKGQYQVSVYGLEQHKILFRFLHPHTVSEHKLRALDSLSRERDSKRNTDGIPYSEALWNLIHEEKGDRAWPKMGTSKFDRSKLFRRSGKISRALLRKLAESWGSEKLRMVADDQIVWERIKSIEPIGRRDCYDICIVDGGDPNFVIQNFIVHNTWAALYIATVLNVHANSRVLVYSLEMKPKQVIRRVAAIRAAINYKSLLAGKLQPADYYRFFEQLKQLQVENKEAKDTGTAVRTARFKVTQGSGGAGISFLQSKIREFRPDFVLVDSFHLMRDDRQKKRSMDWKSVAHVSQDLKGTARDFDVPLMGTCQANRKADKNARNADLEEIAYADAIGQDADFTIRVQKRIDKDTKEPELVLAFPGSREVDIDGFVIHGIPALNFSLKSMNIGSQDEPDDDGGKKGGGKKGGSTPPTIPSARLRGI